MQARPSGRCHTPERKTGLDARNHGVSGAEPAIGPDLPERVEQVRAALPAADRARFKQELDQAVDLARSTRDLGPLGHVVEGCRSDPVSSSALSAGACLMCRSLHQHLQPEYGHLTVESVTCPPSSVGRAHPW
jgi:hypothetical protein